MVGPYSSLMPHALVGGGAKVGARCLLAAGATINPGVRIGDGCRVSAGAVVTRDMPAGHLVFGNPAKAVPDVQGPYGPAGAERAAVAR